TPHRIVPRYEGGDAGTWQPICPGHARLQRRLDNLDRGTDGDGPPHPDRDLQALRGLSGRDCPLCRYRLRDEGSVCAHLHFLLRTAGCTMIREFGTVEMMYLLSAAQWTVLLSIIGFIGGGI